MLNVSPYARERMHELHISEEMVRIAFHEPDTMRELLTLSPLASYRRRYPGFMLRVLIDGERVVSVSTHP